MIVSVVNIFVILISAMVLYFSRRKYQNAAFLGIVLFDVGYVIPLIVELFLGKASVSSSYIGFVLSRSDVLTEVLYGIFVLIVESFFFIYLKKSKKFSLRITDIAIDVRNQLCKIPIVPVLAIILIVFLAVLIFFSPNPTLYYKDLGAFAMQKSSVTSMDLLYRNVVHLGDVTMLAILAILILKTIDKNNSVFYKVIRIAGIVLVTLANGKRTLTVFLVIALMMIDYLYKKKKKYMIINIVMAVMCISIYFIAYSYISGKYEYNTDWYAVISEYFFRNNSIKVVIYSTLHPDKLPILDYPGQTLLFDALFFIPRQFWASKPFPFPDYYTAAIFGFSHITNMGWNFQTNIYAEAIANMGLIAFVITPFFLLLICKKVNESKSIVEYLLGLSFVLLIQVFEFSDTLKIIFFMWVFFCIKRKIKI